MAALPRPQVTAPVARPSALRFAKAQAWEALSIARMGLHYPAGLVDEPMPVGPRWRPGEALPVVLVHGYAHNHSGWYVLEAALRRRGVAHVSAIDHDPWATRVPRIAAQLAAHVRAVLAATGAPKVSLVGHSLGGLIVRWYVQELGGDAHVDRAATICSPHGGAPVSRLAWWRTASDLRAGSPIVERLAAGTRETEVSWLAVWSDSDLLVPGWSARLDDPRMRAEHVHATCHGHLSALVSPAVVRPVARFAAAPVGAAAGPATAARPIAGERLVA